MKYEDFLITSLGDGNVITPLKKGQRMIVRYTNSSLTMKEYYMTYLMIISNKCKETGEIPVSFEKAGRKKLFSLSRQRQKLP
jgi:hypothetical protein